MKNLTLVLGIAIGLVVGLAVTVAVAWYLTSSRPASPAPAGSPSTEAVRMESPRQEPAPASSDEIDGNWRAVSVRNSDGETRADRLGGMVFAFHGRKHTFTPAKDAPSQASAFRLNPFANPKEIDLIAESEPGKEEVRLGIYRLDKGRLIVSFNRKFPALRPAGYVTGPGSGIEVITLERMP